MKSWWIAYWLVAASAGVVAFAETVPASTSADIRTFSDGQIEPNGVFTILTEDAPRAIALRDTGLREAGLQAADVFMKADEIRIFANREVMNASPLARIWINEKEGRSYWFQTGGEGSADAFVIPEGAAVVVWTRASVSPIRWTNVFN